MTRVCIVFIIEYLHQTVQRTSLLKKLCMCTHTIPNKQNTYLNIVVITQSVSRRKNITM